MNPCPNNALRPASHRYQSDFADYRRQFAVNVDGVFVGTRAAADHMRDGGRIIVIGSVNAHTMPVAGGAIYGYTSFQDSKNNYYS